MIKMRRAGIEIFNAHAAHLDSGVEPHD